MDLLAALAAGRQPAAASIDGYPVGWLRAPPGWDTGPRRLEEHLLYLVDSGTILVECAGKTHEAGPGCAVLIPPRTPFRSRTGGRGAPRFWRARLRLPAAWDGAVATPGCRELEPVVARLVAEASADAPHRAEAVRGCLLVLVATLRRLAAGGDGPQLSAALRARLERYADDHAEATPRDLARQLDLTLDYFTRRFRAAYGRPPRRWLLERRMHAAAVRVAEGGEPIARIAAALGYADARLFGRQFRQVLGQPPGRFRARVGEPGAR
jgi:AraC-like DNA-binding protein